VPYNVHTTINTNSTERVLTQGAKNSARTRGFSLTVSSKSAPVKSRTSLDAFTGEKNDNEAASKVRRQVFETIVETVWNQVTINQVGGSGR
jgi:hypothetical protein